MTHFAFDVAADEPWFTGRIFTLAVAFFFLMFGIEKLFAIGDWVRVFERIGFGQWFRYFTGAMQITGAALLVTTRTYLLGAFIFVVLAAWIEFADHRERRELRRLTSE
jgi:hypothetical protein